MQKLYNIILIVTFVFNCKAQDTVSYFNKTLPKRAITGTIGGEIVLLGLGYERYFYSSKSIRLAFSVKLGPSPKSGIVVIPTGILTEIFSGKNKLIVGVYLGNNIHPFAGSYSLKDVREIENNPEYLKTGRPFVYVPYGASTLGFKRYFNKKHALSMYANYGVYPEFEQIGMTQAKLKAFYAFWAGITYHRQF